MLAQIEPAVRAIMPSTEDGASDRWLWWHAILIESGREHQSFAWLTRRLKVTAYLPVYAQKVRCRGTSHRLIYRPIIPGMMFVPTNADFRCTSEKNRKFE